MSPGIHLLHKPIGPTSFSVVQACRAEALAGGGRRPRLCHGGTLDPFASGLLLILAGPATRLFDHLHAIPKIYQATVRWGIETDNGDPGGQIISQADASGLSPTQLQQALQPFIGWHEQTPHPTSAKRICGERAYLKAHRGEIVVMPPSRVYLHEASWLSHDLPRQSSLRLVVRGGYYVRALARDLGRALGCGAHLSQLHRQASGPWTDPGPGQRFPIQGRALLPWMAWRELTAIELDDLRRGNPVVPGLINPADWPLPPAFFAANLPIRGYYQDRLIFLLRADGSCLRPLTNFSGGL